MANQNVLNTEMVGHTFIDVKVIDGEEIIFTRSDGVKLRFYHEQDCCEEVYVKDVCGSLNDLVGEEMFLAEERSNGFPNVAPAKNKNKNMTWTFYVFATGKGWVTISWCGISNGYYSEKVNIEVKPCQN